MPIRLLLSAICLLLVLSPVGSAQEQAPLASPEEVYQEQLGELNLAEIEDFLSGLDQDMHELMPTLDLKSLLLDPSGRGWSKLFADVAKNLFAFFFRELLANTKLMGQLLVLAVCLALLTQIPGAFGDKSFRTLAFAVCYLVLILLGLRSFAIAVGYGLEAINNMVSLMLALLPTYTMLLTGVGAVTTAALLSPVLYGLLSLVSSLMSRVVLPLLFLGVAVGLVGNISGRYTLSQLAGLLRQAATVSLGLLFTVFLGATVVRGVTAPVTDGVALRTTKFLASSFVPIVGKMYSEAIEVVVGSSLLLKNAVGILGIFLILVLCAFPMAKIVAMLFVYKFVNAVIEPISDGQLVKGLGHLESGLTMLFVVVAIVSVCFFVSLTVIIGAGNLAVVMRG